ncbi:MAG: hypothetical protein WBP22_04370 [Candidatus Saccharimonas sp.]
MPHRPDRCRLGRDREATDLVGVWSVDDLFPGHAGAGVVARPVQTGHRTAEQTEILIVAVGRPPRLLDALGALAVVEAERIDEAFGLTLLALRLELGPRDHLQDMLSGDAGDEVGVVAHLTSSLLKSEDLRSHRV